MKNIITCLYSLVCLVYMVSCNGGELKSSNETFEFIESFPQSNQDYFFQYPTQVYGDANYLYINDQPASVVHVINKKGEKVIGLGREGRGPGELLRPFNVYAVNGFVYINDTGNYRIQKFKGDSLVGIINIDKMVSNFAVHKQDIISFVNNYTPGETDSLFYVYNEDGEIVRKFGKELDLFESANRAINEVLLKSDGTKLYVLFNYYPILRIYDLSNYQLEREIDLTHFTEDYKKRVEGNYEPSAVNDPSGGTSTRFLFRSLDVSEEGYSMGVHADHLIVDFLSFDELTFKRKEFKEVEEDYYNFGHEMIDNKVYVVERNPEPRISVYQ